MKEEEKQREIKGEKVNKYIERRSTGREGRNRRERKKGKKEKGTGSLRTVYYRRN